MPVPLIVTVRGREVVEALDGNLQNWRAAFQELIQAEAAGDNDLAVKLAVTKGLPIYEAAGKAAQELQELQTKVLEENRESAAETKNLSRFA